MSERQWVNARLSVEDSEGRHYTFMLASEDTRPLHVALSLAIESLKSGEIDALWQRWLTYDVGERAMVIALSGPLILATRRQDD